MYNCILGSSFSLPKDIIKKINALCRTYLCRGTCDSNKSGYVAWDEIYSPKKTGGLAIRNTVLWNQGVIGKLVWDIAKKQDLWMRWIQLHARYIKQCN